MILRGLVKYARHITDWALNPFYQPLTERFPFDVLAKLDGIIARIEDPVVEQRLANLGVPAICVSRHRRNHVLPSVQPDYVMAGRMAAEHLLACGLKEFAFLQRRPLYRAELSREGFLGVLSVHDIKCHFAPADLPLDDRLDPTDAPQNLADWIAQLPKPIGLLCACDDGGRAVLQACDMRSLRVPEQVAVVGTQNDDMVCELCRPTLSSVDLMFDNVGYRAGETLDRIINDRIVPDDPITVSPSGVVVRESSNVIAIDDPLVADAVRFIRDSVDQSIGVETVLQKVGISRATLDRRFLATLGHTAAQEIRESRIRRAKELLANTDMSLPDVALRTGFRYQPRLSTAFKEATGLTPREYRMQCRA